MKTLTELQRDAEAALAAAEKAGAGQARARVSTKREYSVRTKNDQVEVLQESQTLKLSLALFVDGRYGVFSSSDLSPSTVSTFVDKAVAMVRLTDPDEARGLPDAATTAPLPATDLEVFDPTLAESKKSASRALCAEMTEAARAASPEVMHVEAAYGETHYRAALLTSAGFAGRVESTRGSLSCNTYIRDGDRKQRGAIYRSWRRFGDFDSAEQVGRKATQRAVEMKGARPIAGGEFPIVIVNYWCDHFTGMLLKALDGGAIYRKMSCLGDQIGRPVASELLTMSDDPLVPRGQASRAYDGEGMVARRFPLVDKGVLRNGYFSSYWARKNGVKPTTGGSSNIMFDLGTRSGDAMVSDLERGLFITDFLGGNSNAMSGDFSAGIRGFLIEKGKRLQPFAEMNMAGNLLKLARKLEEVGSDPYPFMSIRCPAMRFGSVVVSGAS